MVTVWSEEFQRKQWRLVCGGEMEGAKVAGTWGNTNCPGCKALKPKKKKKVENEETKTI